MWRYSALRQLCILVCLFLSVGYANAQDYTRPKIRAITGFVRLDPASYKEQIGEALKVLRAVKAEFVQRGYEVQTLRIVTQPICELMKGRSDAEAFAFLKSFDELSVAESFLPNVGPGMMQDTDDPRPMLLLAQALSSLPHIEANAIIASEDGIHWNVIRETATLVHYVSEHSLHSQGTFNFTATAMLQPYGPFFPGAYHTGAGKQFSIGFEGANVVREVFAQTHGKFSEAVSELSKQLTIHARIAEEIGTLVAASTDWTFAGVDPTPAPNTDVSIGAAIETYTGARFGSSGSLTAALIITSAVKEVRTKQIGYSGLMLPVLEDKILAERWAEGTYNVDSLLAYSAVCGTGLDTVPLPELSERQIAQILGDVASLAWKWHKPLSARLQPIKGKKAGDRTDFLNPFLPNTTLHPLP